MSEALAQAFVRLRVDAGSLKSDGDRAFNSIDGVGAGKKIGDGLVQGADGRIRDSRGRFVSGLGDTGAPAGKRFGSGFAASLRSQAGAIGGALVGAALFKFGKDSVAEYKNAQTQQQKLSDAFAKFPGLADTNQTALQKLNTQLAAKTKFDDDATASGQAVLAQFKLTGTQVTELTPLLQDYAAKTGKDLPTAAGDLGKALLGQGRALKGVGINFKDTGSLGGNFDQIMGGLRSQVGGFATGEGKTAAGQSAILKNQFGEIQETVGSKLVPALTALTGGLLAVIGFVQRNSNVIVPLVAVLGGLAAVVYTIVTVTKIWTAVQTAFNIVMALNPIGLIVIGVALLVAGIIIAYKKSETFRNIVTGAFNAVGAVVGAVVNFIKSHWQLLFAILTGPVGLAVKWIHDHWDDIITFFKGAPGKIKTAFSTVGSVILSPFKTAFNGIADAWNNTVGQLSFHIPDWVPKIGGKGFSMPKLPHFAGGVKGFAGGLAVINEHGPGETVLLPPGSDVIPRGRPVPGGAPLIGSIGTIQLLRGGPEDVANDIVFAMRTRGH